VNGFYTYGELGPIDSSRRHLAASKFHNTTLVLCAISGLAAGPEDADLTQGTPAPPAAADLDAENQRLKRENLRLTRTARKLEERIETIDKMARANEQVNLSLYSEIERVRAELEDEKRKSTASSSTSSPRPSPSA
jgi:hypothetical protein